MTNNDNGKNIVFDANSGISEEEQREILEKINNITEKNRQSLSSGAESETGGKKGKKSRRFKAKKSGGLFPILVNAAAFVALAAGLFTLYALHGKKDAQVREGAKVYNSAERALIEEIRRETSSRVEEKENEINKITFLLVEISTELEELYSSGEELSAERQAAEKRLKELQEMLENLQNERSRMLEESRARETLVQAQMESRIRAAAEAAQVNGDNAAGNEMDKLSGEQKQAAAVEDQMAAFFSNLNGQIAENKFDEALGTVQTMREFLNTPAFQALRSIQARKDIYAQAINSFETMINNARPGTPDTTLALPPPPPQNNPETEKMLIELQKKAARLEEDLAGKEKTIATLNSGHTDSAQSIATRDRQIADLNSKNATSTRAIEEKDGQIAALTRQTDEFKTQNDNLNQTITRQKDSLDRINEVVTIILERDPANIATNEMRNNMTQIQRDLDAALKQ